MTIKENIELINNTLNRSYTELQNLAYEEGIEAFVRVKLLDITNVSRELLEFIHSQDIKQRHGKNRLKKKWGSLKMSKLFILSILCGINFGLWQESFVAASFMIILLIFVLLLCDEDTIWKNPIYHQFRILMF